VAAKGKKTLRSGAKSPPESTKTTVESTVVDTLPPYLAVSVQASVTEESAVPVFEAICQEILRDGAHRVLVDLRESSVELSISDMLGIAKMTAAKFSGVLDRLAVLVRPKDLLSEKFFEPSVSSRGVPTFVTSDAAEATYWIASKTKLPR
jgi:hypothetical protein